MINDLSPGAEGGAKADGHDLRLRESPTEGVFCEGLRHVQVGSPSMGPGWLADGLAREGPGLTGRCVASVDACSPALLVWAADGVQVDSLQAVFGIIAAGNSVRHVAGTNVNSRSSRSHTLLMMQLTQPSTAPEDEQGGGKKTKKQREREREQAQMLHAPPAATTTISTLQVT